MGRRRCGGQPAQWFRQLAELVVRPLPQVAQEVADEGDHFGVAGHQDQARQTSPRSADVNSGHVEPDGSAAVGVELGDRPMASIRRSDVQTLVKMLSGRLSPGSVRNVYDVTSRLFSAAVDDMVIASSPCRRIVLPQADSIEVSVPTVEQVSALVESVEPRYRAAVVLLAGSGVRIGELLGLRVSDVDWLRQTLRVERQRLQDGTIAPTKTAKSVRTVPLGQVVVDELAAHLATYPSSEWLFTTETGEPLAYRRWKRVWAAARTDGLDTHSLRHFYASALIAGGASVKQVSSVLGHSSAVVTLRVYSHLWPGDDDRTRAVIDSVLAGLVDGLWTADASDPRLRRSEA